MVDIHYFGYIVSFMLLILLKLTIITRKRVTDYRDNYSVFETNND
jgi:hypothetical protein